MTAIPLSEATIISDIKNIEDSKLREVAVLLASAAFELRNSADTLAKWGLGFVLVWSFILGSVAFATYRQLRNLQIAPDDSQLEAKNFFDQALAGKLELWKVFWGGYVGLSLASAGIIKFFLLAGSNEKSSFLLSVLVGPIVLSIPSAIYLCSAVLVWRSASNTSSVLWHYSAKAVVIACTVIPLLRGIYSASVILKLYG